jgi:hypothetical protein
MAMVGVEAQAQHVAQAQARAQAQAPEGAHQLTIDIDNIERLTEFSLHDKRRRKRRRRVWAPA